MSLKAGTRRGTRVLFVYPSEGNAFYSQLAFRLATAVREAGRQAAAVDFSAFLTTCEETLADATVAWVNPQECLLTAPVLQRRLPDLSSARRVLLVIAEAVETDWYDQQFRLSISYDGVLDVGFVSQQAKHRIEGVPYVFIFNGWTEVERRRINSQRPSVRPIPWAMIGHRTYDRLRLAHALASKVSPKGFVFLPSLRPLRSGSALLSPRAVAAILSKSSYYVWRSHHEYGYYESFRFVDAILNGAVPIKIVSESAPALGIPGIAPSVESFAKAAERQASGDLFESAREYYVGRGGLAEHAAAALERVDG